MNAVAATAAAKVCTPLANTGLPLFVLIALGGLCLLGGAVLLVLVSGRRGWRARIAALLLLAGGLAFGIAVATPAGAATPNCLIGAPNNSLTITQVSTITGLAPDFAPVAITGLVVNHSADSTFVTSVTVNIASVTKRSGAVAGQCTVSDYVLFDPTMPVGVMLRPGASTTFAGAKIGFNDKASNQDACQGALVGLSYVST
jgi:hypothetical protein